MLDQGALGPVRAHLEGTVNHIAGAVRARRRSARAPAASGGSWSSGERLESERSRLRKRGAVDVWAVLHREDWLIDTDSHRRLGAAARVRLLLKWVGIPTAVPPSLPLLAALGKSEWEGPEILLASATRWSILRSACRKRSGLTPNFSSRPGSWYLELALLRVFGYRGRYWSRIRLNRPDADGEPVPWSAAD